jgi:hypothetical protein
MWSRRSGLPSWRGTGTLIDCPAQGNSWPGREGLLSVVATESRGGWLSTVVHNQDLPPPERVEQFAGLLRS